MPNFGQPGVIFNTVELIKNEYNPTGLASYIGIGIFPCSSSYTTLFIALLYLLAYACTNSLILLVYLVLISSFFGADMVLNAEKRARLVEVLSSRDDIAAKASTSARPASPATQIAPEPPSQQAIPTPSSPQAAPAPTSASPTPIVVVPLAAVRASPPPARLDKNKGVVLIASDDEEDTMGGPTFKRRKTTTVAPSHSYSAERTTSLRDNPPSATSPQNLLELEDGAERVPVPAPALELPLVLQQILKGYQKGAMGSSTDEAMQEILALSLREFFARANSSSHEAELKTKEQQVLAEELALVKEQMAK